MLPGEHEYRLEPLLQKDAAALFVERAHAVGREGRTRRDRGGDSPPPRRPSTRGGRASAAARTKLLAPERLLERLDSALAVLTSGARDAPERQRTLRATIEWSYALLEPRTRGLLRPPLGLLRPVPTGGSRGSLRRGPRRSWRAGRLQPRQADRRRPVLDARDHRRVRPREAPRGERRGGAAPSPRRVLRGACRAGLRQSLRRGGRVGRTVERTTTTCVPHWTGCRKTTRSRARALAGALGVVLAFTRHAP